MPYRIDLHGAGGEGLDRLVELGALDVEWLAQGLAALMPDRVSPDEVAGALGVPEFTVSAARGRDAGSVWTLTPRPVRLGSDALALIDSPVFGTGMHPTTILCLDILQEIVGHDLPPSVLDVGTGSGVLAIAALRLGVPRAMAIDIDADSTWVAAENARENGVRDRLGLVRGGPDALSGAWPLVLANVLAAPLVAMAPALVRRVAHHGLLVLSGIPASLERDVVGAYRNLGMHHLATHSRAGWVAALMRASW